MRAYATALLGSTLLLGLAYFALATTGQLGAVIGTGVRPAPTTVDILGMTLFAPLLETIALGALARVALRLMASPALAAATVAAVFAGLHGLVHPLWFVGTVWSFYVYTRSYLAWVERSRTLGFLAAALPHALVNGTVVAVAWADARLWTLPA